jgi:Abnormal spindle-like microcephaly-assoc'd, ASPM-SPD-2-Hydin
MAITIVVFLMSTANFASSSTATRTLTVSPSNIWFGGVPIGQTRTHTVTLTNSSKVSVSISKMIRTDKSFSSNLNLPMTLGAGKSTQFVVTFAPTFVGHINAAFVVTSSASDSVLDVYVHGGGRQTEALVPSSSALSFAGVQVGSSQTLQETLTNSGSASIKVSAVSTKGAQFSVTGPDMPLTLASGYSMTVSVTFTPTTTKTVSGDLAVLSNSPNLTIPLSGSAGSAGTLSVSPGSLSFGKVAVGSSANKTETLSASGGSVVVSAASVNSSEFSLTGLTLPATIAAGSSISFTATFTPQSTGAASADFTFSGNTSSVTQALGGTGTGSASHSVGLSWQASTSSVEGYNVYRGNAASGPYSKLTASLDANTMYTDGTVKSGNTYFYVTTAIGTDGVESGYSNQVEAVIP